MKKPIALLLVTTFTCGTIGSPAWAQEPSAPPESELSAQQKRDLAKLQALGPALEHWDEHFEAACGDYYSAKGEIRNKKKIKESQGRADLCLMAFNQRASNNSQRRSLGYWIVASAACTAGCVMSFIPYTAPAAPFVCPGANAGATGSEIVDAIASQEKTEKILGLLGQLGGQAVGFATLIGTTAAAGGKAGATQGASSSTSTAGSVAACVSAAATVGMTVFKGVQLAESDKNIGEPIKAAMKMKSLGQAVQVTPNASGNGSALSLGSGPSHSGSESLDSASGSTSGSHSGSTSLGSIDPGAQCDSQPSPSSQLHCLAASGIDIPKNLFNPEAQEVLKNNTSGMTVPAIASRASGMGIAEGIAMALGNSGEALDFSKKTVGEMETALKSFKARGGSTSSQSPALAGAGAGSGVPHMDFAGLAEGMSTMMDGLMANLMRPGAEGKAGDKGASGLGALDEYGRRIEGRSVEAIEQDRGLSLFGRVSHRYRKKLREWATVGPRERVPASTSNTNAAPQSRLFAP